MAQVIALLLMLDVALVLIALVDCLRADESAIRTAPWAAWMFAILLISPIGAIAWFVKGRPVVAVPLRSRPVFVAPDDNPEFLKSLTTAIRERDSDL
ncbi:PLD nuclease N-terminal domain-containing protein [Paractinoplanes lichenicola]|uniref:PLDc_N domain-containing protein n=1 Tax=Paractinoplanes lichenicola TaxID=2802976 RepID=A0ABS1VII3_9ACTN|nr:PLD nuclease N-terminal domain-containing protein [Actinoplanes lichenicola]MBL7254301.1 PLDc_N domain-containing protein [Actinoplanes lichenicola]